MKLKKCSLCKADKEINNENFHYKNKLKNQFTSICKICWKQYHKKHYENNKNDYKIKSKNWQNERRKEFYNWLKTKSCVDCGNSDFRVLEFDHITDKKFEISRKIKAMLLTTLLEEISKCEIVCANCHKIRTAERGNFYHYLD